MWQHESGSQIKCQSYFHSKNKICWQHQSSHLLRDLDTKKVQTSTTFLPTFWAIHKWLTIFVIKVMIRSVKSGDMWKGGVRKAGKTGDVTYEWPLSKTSLQKTQRSKSCFCCERCFTHPHVRAHAQWIIAVLKFIYSEKATKFCKISTIDLTGTT